MAAGSSRVPALIDWLVSAFQNAPALQALLVPALPTQAAQAVVTYDGPVANDQDAKFVIWVGVTDPMNLAAEPAATFTQTRADLGNLTRDEQSEIHCVAADWTGSNDFRTARLNASAILAAAETIIRSDTTQFGGNAALAAPGVSAGDLMQNTTQQGGVAWIPFTVIFKSFT